MITKSNQIQNELVLIQECIDGNRKSQHNLYNTYAGKMYAICLRYLGNEHDAQDCLQNGFIKLFTSLKQFRGEGAFEGWARKIFVFTCIESLRKVRTTTSDFDNLNVENNDLNGFDKISMKDLLEIIQSLPEGFRTVVNLYMVEGYLHREISEMLGISEGTSKSQLARAKIILQTKISLLLN